MEKTNPFPGVNPWMQRRWGDVHLRLLTYIADDLGTALPDDLFASGEERVLLNSIEDGEAFIRPDVAVIGPESWKKGEVTQWSPDDDENLPTPVLVETEDIVDRWIEIRTGSGKLVTVIELLSPSNKSREGRKLFEKKLNTLVAAGVNTMEIDLLADGLCVTDSRSGFWPKSDYRIVVNRALQWSLAEVYPFHLEDPVPPVRVPLRDSESDIVLQLQPLIDRCYEMGRYWQTNYKQAPPDLLSDDQEKWAKEKLREAGLLGE